ncbi:NHLP family bacteriocin export ABC transporter peptidase/permease/ATPase subunit [Pollutimonas sp. M17]|uniref:NHLP family bacteriocin export ABC transporter peptidase/permease/ATPase subunit n=1 Tax=Pollutimonas sp. M17 TaxID=2962065 RepID=UPI0021F47CE1|nr:NHLP family bacteriocin export ABC transporter peptidase/permease/ATPase subunit [Pollutimonas sp. M17]UYO92203.1 NHLP family bacteriocin export ABC transporter peptidase/permease/ATPase subunit [Pollutimonas sp. M17]HWK70200.1 NHLP family bacteriocin export ABC transporter peptidase/permease/ATPase subunit [Burkholderiaceae bacterium]
MNAALMDTLRAQKKNGSAGPGQTKRRIRTPTILQMEALECGAAALAMVLAYHGRWTPLEELRTLCGVSRDGSKALNILKAARSLGMDAKGMRLEPAGLANIALPAILFVDMNHFVVLEGVGPDGFHLNDPAIGRRKVSAEDFDGMFSGIALVFSRTDAFKPGGAPRRMLPALFDLAGGSLGALAVVMLAGVLMVAISLITPAFNRVFIDYVMIEELKYWLTPLLLSMAAAAIVLALLTWLRLHLVMRLHVKLGLVLSGRLSWHILRLPASFFAQRHSGMISARLPLAEQIAQLASQQLAQMAIGITTLVFFTALMLQYHVILTLICIGMASLNAIVFSYLQRRLGESSENIALQSIKMDGKVMQGLQMIETLKATGADNIFFAKWAGLQALFINARQRVAHMQTLVASLPALTAALTSALVISLGGLFVIENELTVGMLVAFTAILASFSAPVNELMALAVALRGAQGSLAQVDDTLRHPIADEFGPERSLPASGKQALRLSGSVSLHDVSVGYSPLEPPLIEHLDLDMKPGSRVALVGGSGSGKTTVGRLISGMLDPWSGRILFDGTPLPELPRPLLRHSLSVVNQEIVLFEGTVRENLTLWDDSMPIEQVAQAAKDAMIHDLIMSRRGAYDSHVEEDGRNFSGGQRQRLEIARALAGNPSVLIMDEATSALDTISEKAIVANLRRRGCTCIIIAHRLSTIRDCDEIIVLDQGKILERGTHEQLMQHDGAYRALIEN